MPRHLEHEPRQCACAKRRCLCYRLRVMTLRARRGPPSVAIFHAPRSGKSRSAHCAQCHPSAQACMAAHNTFGHQLTRRGAHDKCVARAHRLHCRHPCERLGRVPFHQASRSMQGSKRVRMHRIARSVLRPIDLKWMDMCRMMVVVVVMMLAVFAELVLAKASRALAHLPTTFSRGSLARRLTRVLGIHEHLAL